MGESIQRQSVRRRAAYGGAETSGQNMAAYRKGRCRASDLRQDNITHVCVRLDIHARGADALIQVKCEVGRHYQDQRVGEHARLANEPPTPQTSSAHGRKASWHLSFSRTSTVQSTSSKGVGGAIAKGGLTHGVTSEVIKQTKVDIHDVACGPANQAQHASVIGGKASGADVAGPRVDAPEGGGEGGGGGGGGTYAGDCCEVGL
jgi:hypothetical protein